MSLSPPRSSADKPLFAGVALGRSPGDRLPRGAATQIPWCSPRLFGRVPGLGVRLRHMRPRLCLPRRTRSRRDDAARAGGWPEFCCHSRFAAVWDLVGGRNAVGWTYRVVGSCGWYARLGGRGVRRHLGHVPGRGDVVNVPADAPCPAVARERGRKGQEARSLGRRVPGPVCRKKCGRPRLDQRAACRPTFYARTPPRPGQPP